MATITINGTVTFDESSGLQNSGVPVPGQEDNNDSDVALSVLQSGASAFYSRLFDAIIDGGLALDSTFAGGALGVPARGVGKSADSFITVSGDGGTITALGFVNGSGGSLPVYDGTAPFTDGVLITDGVTAMTTADGSDAGTDPDNVYLFADPELGDRMVLGVDSSGGIVFALFLDPTADLTSARVWMVQFEPINNPNALNPDDPVNLFDTLGVAASSELSFNFDNLPSGANLFGVVGDPDNAIIVIGENPDVVQLGESKKDKDLGQSTNDSDTIHTSQGGTGATIGVNNQLLDVVGEGVFFTYVKEPVEEFLSTGEKGGLNSTEADDAENIQYTGGTLEANIASFTISQTQGNDAPAVTISAFDIDDAPQGLDFVNEGLGTDDPDNKDVAITAIRVYDATGTKIEDTENLAKFNDPDVVVTPLADGDMKVEGLDDGYKVEWVTKDVHDQVLIENFAAAFDIGAFEISQPQATPDKLLPFTVEIEDFDGDTDSATFNIGIDGDHDGIVAGLV